MGEAAALIAAFTWSATSVAMTRLSVTVSAVAMSALRLVFASLIIPFVLVLSGQTGQLADAPASAIIAMVGSGLLAYAIGDTLYIVALSRMGLQRAFIVTMALYIVLTVVGGVVLLDETITVLQSFGGVLVGLGLYLVVRGRPAEGDSARPLRVGRTELAIVAGVGLTWAAATLWLAEGRAELDSIAASTIRTPAGAAGMLAFGMVTARHDLMRPLRDRRQVIAILAIAIAGTLFGSLLYVYAVGEAGPGRTSILNACAPVLALPLSVLILKERLRPLVALGTLICVGGIALVVA